MIIILFALVTFAFCLPERSGFVTTNATNGYTLFYWAIYSSNNFKTDPVVLWLNGGPGSSSIIYGLLNENGPYRVDNALNLKTNPYSWTNNATMIYVDNPTGVGYSHQTVGLPYLGFSSLQAMRELHTFLQLFFQQYPELNQGQPFYLFGESYAGKYMTDLASLLISERSISLAGVALGNAYVDPVIQIGAWIEFAQANGLIPKTTANVLQSYYESCRQGIESGSLFAEIVDCNLIFLAILAENPGMSIYDIRLHCPSVRLNCLHPSEFDIFANLMFSGTFMIATTCRQPKRSCSCRRRSGDCTSTPRSSGRIMRQSLSWSLSSTATICKISA